MSGIRSSARSVSSRHLRGPTPLDTEATGRRTSRRGSATHPYDQRTAVRSTRGPERRAPPRRGCWSRSCRWPTRGGCARSRRTGAPGWRCAATGAPASDSRSTSRSRSVSGLGPPVKRFGGQRRVDDPEACVHPSDRLGQLLRRGVLHDEPARAGVQGAPEVAGPTERRDDEGAAAGRDRGQLLGDRDAVEAGHLDVEEAHVGRRARAAVSTSSPFPTSATTSMSGSRSSSAAIAPRTSAWSSASSTLIVTAAPSVGCRHRWGRPDLDRATGPRPVRGVRGARCPPASPALAVVGDRQPVRAQLDAAASGPSCAGRRW